MEAEELEEVAHEARRKEQRRIGMTMALFAALLALTTMLGHRTHTEEGVLQTRTTDDWAFYQAKNGRAQMFDADAELAQLSGPPGAALAESFRARAAKERSDAEGARQTAERREEETRRTARRGALFDAGEIFLEVAIVLCSIALLADALVFWRMSFISAVVGVILGTWGLLGM